MRRTLTAVALAFAAPAVAAPEAAATGCTGARANPNHVSIATAQSATTCLINRKRVERGRPRLYKQSQLEEAAVGHSRRMVSKGFFSHTSPNGDGPVDRIRRTGYLRGSNNWAIGEVIAWGAANRAIPRSIVRGWMRSRGHRRAILSREYRHIGVGIARGAPVNGARSAATYTVDFGRR